jgi:Chitobiase/beta-hexosaminidase C-terminal domain
MRIHVVLWVIALSSSLLAQTPGMNAAQQAQQAAQQAAQASQQASQEAMRQAQQANEDAARASQQASQNAQQGRICPPAARPQFSVKAGSFTKPVTVKIREKTRGAVVYYTIDGWTPTTNSTRYTGPVTITSTTTLQAIAVAPHMPRSRIASGVYTVSAPAVQSGPVAGTAVATAPPVESSPTIRMLTK